MGHNGSAFDSCIVLNNRSNWRRIVNAIKNGKGNISSKLFDSYVKISENKAVPQNICLRAGLVDINTCFRKKDATCKIQQGIFKKRKEES